MDSKQTEQQTLQIGKGQLLALVREFTGGASRARTDDEHPLPPGPWDPVIRQAVEHVRVFGPHPEPWRTRDLATGRGSEILRVLLVSILRQHPEIWDVIGGGHSLVDEVALNPQPLPPRYAFLISVVQVVASRAELLQEMAGAMSQPGSQQGIIVVGGYTARFADDWCGTGWRLGWPFPGPRPNWLSEQLDAADLLVIATALDQAAKESHSADLRKNLTDASARFTETAMERMQEPGEVTAQQRTKTKGMAAKS
jgi:hypothetical protein